MLLTNDLTKAVVDEAIARKDSIIVTYHPIIFRGLKALTLANSQQQSLLRLAQEGISVYCPHTAVDAAPGGVNDWLADIVTGTTSDGSFDSKLHTSEVHERKVIVPVKDVEGFEEAGYGRIVRFHAPQKLGSLVSRITKGLGSLSGLCVAVPQSVPSGSKSDIEISSVGICAGSGGSMLNGLDVDLFFTGDLSHHEALAAIEQGKCVITAFHSNTERAFLKQRMQHALTAKIKEQSESREQGPFEVAVSTVDRDPYEIVMADQTSW